MLVALESIPAVVQAVPKYELFSSIDQNDYQTMKIQTPLDGEVEQKTEQFYVKSFHWSDDKEFLISESSASSFI